MFNQFTGVGNLVKDAEERLAGSSPVITFTIACNDSFTDKQGERQERVEYIKVNWFTKYTNAVSSLRKGTQVVVIGKVQNRSYETKDGKKMTDTSIFATKVSWPKVDTDSMPF